MIGKSRLPHCFHHVNMKSLPFKYTKSSNTWMTSIIFEDLLHKPFVSALHAQLHKQKLEAKTLLVLDNSPTHPPAVT